MSRIRLTTRVTLACVGVSAAVTMVTALVGAQVATRAERDAIDDRLQQIAAAVDRPLVATVLTRLADRPINRPAPASFLAEGTFVIVEGDAGENAHFGDVPDRLDLPSELGFSNTPSSDGSVRVLTTPAEGAELDRALVHVGAPLEEVQSAARAAARRVLTVGAAATGLAALLGWLVASRIARPLVALRATALQIASGHDPDARAPSDGPADLGEVATTFNHMLDELDRQRASTAESLEAARSFSASVAHELRTPLTGMRADLDVLDRNPELTRAERDDIVHALLDQHQRVTATMTALEQLAQSDLGHAMPSEAVDLADVADAVAQEAQTLYPNATIELHVDARAACCDGSSDGLRLALSNLVANAARHAPTEPGGEVHVDIHVCDGPDGNVAVHIDDDGPGIIGRHRQAALQRFWTDGAAGGTGLGLAIAAQQARLHGGELALGDSPLGGCRATIALPAAGRPR